MQVRISPDALRMAERKAVSQLLSGEVSRPTSGDRRVPRWIKAVFLDFVRSDNYAMSDQREEWRDESYPNDFHTRNIRLESALAISALPPAGIAAYFRLHPEVANDLLLESCDKRFSPSSFITENNDGFTVGWYSLGKGYQCTRQFSDLADAATDYLLFSLGKGRWKP